MQTSTESLQAAKTSLSSTFPSDEVIEHLGESLEPLQQLHKPRTACRDLHSSLSSHSSNDSISVEQKDAGSRRTQHLLRSLQNHENQITNDFETMQQIEDTIFKGWNPKVNRLDPNKYSSAANHMLGSTLSASKAGSSDASRSLQLEKMLHTHDISKNQLDHSQSIKLKNSETQSPKNVCFHHPCPSSSGEFQCMDSSYVLKHFRQKMSDSTVALPHTDSWPNLDLSLHSKIDFDTLREPPEGHQNEGPLSNLSNSPCTGCPSQEHSRVLSTDEEQESRESRKNIASADMEFLVSGLNLANEPNSSETGVLRGPGCSDLSVTPRTNSSCGLQLDLLGADLKNLAIFGKLSEKLAKADKNNVHTKQMSEERLKMALDCEPSRQHSPSSSSSSPTAGRLDTSLLPKLNVEAACPKVHFGGEFLQEISGSTELTPSLSKGRATSKQRIESAHEKREDLPCHEQMIVLEEEVTSSCESKEEKLSECSSECNTIHLTDSGNNLSCANVEDITDTPRGKVNEAVKLANLDADFNKLKKSLRRQFTKTEKYLHDKEYISSTPSSPRNVQSCSSDEMTHECIVKEVSIQTTRPMAVQTTFGEEETTCSTVTAGEMDQQLINSHEKDWRINALEIDVKRLEGEVGIGSLYAENLMDDAQRYKTRYEAEVEANSLLSNKLDRSEAKIGNLLTSLSQAQNKLSTAEMELSVLRDPQVCKMSENGDLKTQLQEALNDRKLALGQLKGVEKLLEEVITEKDDLLTSSSELKIEVNKLRRECSKLEQKVKDYEINIKNLSETESSLQQQVSEQREKILQYQKRHNQVLKEKDENISKLAISTAHQIELQENNEDLQEEVNMLKSRLVKFDSEVMRWEDEMARANEGQAEELDNWRDLVRQSSAEAHDAQNALRTLQREFDRAKKKWSEEKSDLQREMHNEACALKTAEERVATLERENDAMSIAITEKLPIELEDTKCALEQAKEDINKLEDEKVQLLAVLNESSPTSDLLAEKKALEQAREDITALKEQNSNMMHAIRENFQEEISKVNDQLDVSKKKVILLTASNAEFSKTVTEDHPEELSRLNGLLETANEQVRSLQEQNKDLMYAVNEQSYRIQQCSRQATESLQKKKELSRLLQVATQCNKLNKQTSDCVICMERAAAVTRLCHDMCVYIEQERKGNKLLTEQSIAASSEKSATIDMTEMDASLAQISSPIIDPKPSSSDVIENCKRCKELEEQIESLKQSQLTGTAEDLVDDTLLSNQVLRNQVNRMEAEFDKLQTELESAKVRFQADVDDQIKELTEKHSEVLEKAELSIKQSKSVIAKGKLLEEAKRYNSITVPELIQVVKIDPDVSRIKEVTTDNSSVLFTAESKPPPETTVLLPETKVLLSEAKELLPETKVLLSEAKELSNKDANEKDEDTAGVKLAVTGSGVDLARQSLEEKAKVIYKLTEQNSDLAKQVETLSKLLIQEKPKNDKDDKKDKKDKNEESAILTELENAKTKLNKQAVEMDQLAKRLRASQQELQSCGKAECNASIAYIVRQRETEIQELKSQVAELQRSLVNQSKQIASDPASMRRKCRGSSGRLSKIDLAESFAELSKVTSNTNRALVATVLAEENQRLKEVVDEVSQEKENLQNSLTQKETALVELRNTVRLHEVAAKAQLSRKDLNVYSKKLKEGESELSRLQVQVTMMSQRADSLFSEKDEPVIVRTDYAQQLSHLINDCINGSEGKETEMKQLCDKLDIIEGANFDYEEQMKELAHLKNVTLPKLQADVKDSRTLFDEAKAELNTTTRNLKEVELANSLLRLEKEEAEETCRSNIEKFSQEKCIDREELDNMEAKYKEQIEEKTSEMLYLRKELTSALADAQEKEGSASHWKLQHDQKNRELKDQEEKHEIMFKAKEQELRRVRGSHLELQRGIGNTKQETEVQLAKVTKQLKIIQQKHLEVINKTTSSENITEESLNKLYSEIGDLNVSLHSEVKELTRELARLQEELKNVQEERETFQEECAKMLQDKQIEIRRLNSHVDKTEVEAARLGAMKEKEISKLKEDLKLKLDRANTEKVHLNVKKGTEASKLRQENEKIVAGQRKDFKVIAELREKIKKLEQSKGELGVQKETLSAETEQIKKELERCQADRKYYEKMVERLNGEMEMRIASVRHDSTRALQVKTEHTAVVYEKLEKIARERGNLSTELYSLLHDRDAKIDSLNQQVEVATTSLDKAESDFKVKLEKKNKEIKTLRSEIKKMGTEGMKLLEQREKEILEMRSHLRNVLKVMDNRTKLSRDSTPVLTARESASGFKEIKHAKSVSSGGSNQTLVPRIQTSVTAARGSLSRKTSKK